MVASTGLYRQNAGNQQECISDYMVVSHIPALRTAINSLEKATHPLSKRHLRALLIAVPQSVGMDFLPDAEDEIDLISRLMALRTCIDMRPFNEKAERNPSGTTANEVLAHLPEAEVLQFACHGRHVEVLLETGFLMSDSVLGVADLVFHNFPRARFALFGACETVQVGGQVPQSATYLAAALLFVGFQSVIGIM